MNILFILIMIMGTTITISSSNWMGMWMGLEINLMSFIPLIYKTNNIKSSESSIIYFLAQSIGSMIMIFSIMLNPFITLKIMNEMNNIILMMAILLKLGAAPMYMWFVNMMTNMHWKEMFLLMTWQKISPMYILSMMSNNKWMYLMIILSTIMGAIGGMNMTSLNKIMAYSSINHMGWMMMLTMMQSSWIKYLIVYSIILLMMCMFFNYYNYYNIGQVMNKSSSLIEKYTCSSMLLSMGGLPPFLGFLPKWMTIQSMINNNLNMIMLIMLMMSMITLFYYMRMISSLLMIYSSSNKWTSQKTINNKMMYLMYINLLLPTVSIFSFY
uniref:NADH-ubiquinone oxidoreductase chain 2 n=1 Tax=Appolonius crassus TaxID=2813428 RepID=A0A8T9ZWT6_9HEMI|nr:NADH dehydrogenase subunit 2 [Appolonius crassus]